MMVTWINPFAIAREQKEVRKQIEEQRLSEEGKRQRGTL
jgi:hypothetical protein